MLRLPLISVSAIAIVCSYGLAHADESIAVAKVPAKAHPKATPHQAAAPLPHLLKEVEAKYFKASTVVADFAETNESAALNQTKKSSGTILFKRPGKIRWETLKPDHNILIGNGKKFWFYTPPFDKDEPGQYWEKDASQVQTQFAQGLLAGTFSYNVSRGAMAVKQASPTDFTVTPKKGTAGTVKTATLHVDPAKKLIVGITLLHRGGNKSDIQLSHIRLGEHLDEAAFHFTPPPNTEKMVEN